MESVIRLELFYQKKFQCFKSGLSHQSPFQAAPSEDLPLQRHYLGDEHLVDHIDRLYRRADAREKLVISRGILVLEEQGGPNTANRCICRGTAAISVLLSLFLDINATIRLDKNESPTRATLHISHSSASASGSREARPSLWHHRISISPNRLSKPACTVSKDPHWLGAHTQLGPQGGPRLWEPLGRRGRTRLSGVTPY